MAVEKAREGNKKAGAGGRGERAGGDESLCHFVMSYREETRQKGGEQFLVEFGERSRA